MTTIRLNASVRRAAPAFTLMAMSITAGCGGGALHGVVLSPRFGLEGEIFTLGDDHSILKVKVTLPDA